MTIVDWANRELEVLSGQVAYLSSGAAKFYDGPARDAEHDRTNDCIEMLQRHIDQWKALMALHGIALKKPNTDVS